MDRDIFRKVIIQPLCLFCDIEYDDIKSKQVRLKSILNDEIIYETSL